MDMDYLLALQHAREALGPAVEDFFVAITVFGMPYVLLLLIAAIYYAVDKRTGVYALATTFSGLFVNEFLKICFCVYRPWIRDSRLYVSPKAASGAVGYSFPSGHSTVSAATFGAIASRNRGRKGVVAACVVIGLLIPFSRNYLGCHTPEDVLVGIALGLASVFVVARVIGWVEAGENRDLGILSVVLVVSAAAIAFACLKTYPIDTDATGALVVDPASMVIGVMYAAGGIDGVMIGLVAERRIVGFENTTSRRKKAIRLVPGVALIIATLLLSTKLTPLVGANAATFMVGFAPTIIATFLWPLAFVRIERRLDAREARG